MDPHIFEDLDPGSQNVVDQTDLYSKYCVCLKCMYYYRRLN